MTREDRKRARQSDRRKAKQMDHVLTASVAAIGGGSVDDWVDMAEIGEQALSGQKIGVTE